MKIGFIGLGIMGKPMAKNPLRAGHGPVVYNTGKANVVNMEAADDAGALVKYYARASGAKTGIGLL